MTDCHQDGPSVRRPWSQRADAHRSPARLASSALITPSPSASSSRKAPGGPRNSARETTPSPFLSIARNHAGPALADVFLAAGGFAAGMATPPQDLTGGPANERE